jgi:hypothetical protein
MRIHFDDNFLWVAHQELESFILFYRSLYSQTKNWSDTSGWFRSLKITSMVVNGQLRLVLGLIKFGGSLKKKPRVFTSFDRIGQSSGWRLRSCRRSSTRKEESIGDLRRSLGLISLGDQGSKVLEFIHKNWRSVLIVVVIVSLTRCCKHFQIVFEIKFSIPFFGIEWSRIEQVRNSLIKSLCVLWFFFIDFNLLFIIVLEHSSNSLWSNFYNIFINIVKNADQVFDKNT